MIEVVRTIETHQNLARWLDSFVGPHLTPDISNYARGRQRCWLGTEPPLGKGVEKPGLQIPPEYWARLTERIGWRFDFCLATYSGPQHIGITPHRDASYADYECYGLNVSQTCVFSYWNGRESFGPGPDTHGYLPNRDIPTHIINMGPGTLIRFNCKNLHAADPAPYRWGINFWRRKTSIQ